MNDAFHRLYQWYVWVAGSVSDETVITLIRIALLFAVPTIILYWTFINGQREGAARFLASIVAEGIVLALPIPVPYDMVPRAWILAICAIALGYLPGILPFLIVREAGRQQRLRKGLYAAAGILTVVGLLWR